MIPDYYLNKLTVTRWYPIASKVFVNNHLGNGYMPNRQQTITWTNADLLSIVPFHKDFSPSGEQLEHHK